MTVVMSLMLVALFYTFFDDLREVMQKIIASAFGKKQDSKFAELEMS